MGSTFSRGPVTATARSLSTDRRPDQQVAIAVAVEPFVDLVDKRKAHLGEPATDVLSIWVVVVPAGLFADILAVHGGQAGRRRLHESAFEFSPVDLLDRQVQVAARHERPS